MEDSLDTYSSIGSERLHPVKILQGYGNQYQIQFQASQNENNRPYSARIAYRAGVQTVDGCLLSLKQTTDNLKTISVDKTFSDKTCTGQFTVASAITTGSMTKKARIPTNCQFIQPTSDPFVSMKFKALGGSS